MKYFLLAIALCYSSVYINAQVTGCPDPAANNYNSAATINDGSCTYNNITLKPKSLYNFSSTLDETSGLAWWKKLVFTFNDSGGEAALYVVNTSTNTIQRKIVISNAKNVDWEDITQDSKYFYIGDMGNNAHGNRKDLKIYRVSKSAINLKDTITASVINFSYEDQTDFTPQPNNNTDFDCEALIAYKDSLFLFSKNWITNKTRLYKLPKKPGTYTAIKIGELDVQGLITGAEIVAAKRTIVLTGYTSLLQPFIYLLYDFSGNNFFDANKRKIILSESFTQTEGICAKSSTTFLISNEHFSRFGINTPAKLEQLSLGTYLNPYYHTLSTTKTSNAVITTINENITSFATVTAMPDKLNIKRNLFSANKMIVQIFDVNGRVKYSNVMHSSMLNVDISQLPPGIYFTKVFMKNNRLEKKFVVQ